MSWSIRPTANLPDDVDAIAYIAAVEVADAEPLELGVKRSINAFVKGCKADGIWDAIKASCIMAGARTLAGALVPLKGTAPTNFNFVSGDYNRKTGLVGDGSTKYLDSNRNNNADPQNSQHLAVLTTTTVPWYIGAGVITNESGATNIGYTIDQYSSRYFSRSRSSAANELGAPASAGFAGINRATSSDYNLRLEGSVSTVTRTSSTPYNGTITLFANSSGSFSTNARLAYYSIGESMDLALLDARVTTLINTFATTIL